MDKIFVGMVKGTNMFLLGQVVETQIPDGWSEDKMPLRLKNVARVFEIPTGEGKIGYQFHPDPYFTNEATSEVSRSEFLVFRTESNPDDKMVKEYQGFLNQVRMQKMGLVPGHINPEKAKSNLREIK